MAKDDYLSGLFATTASLQQAVDSGDRYLRDAENSDVKAMQMAVLVEQRKLAADARSQLAASHVALDRAKQDEILARADRYKQVVSSVGDFFPLLEQNITQINAALAKKGSDPLKPSQEYAQRKAAIANMSSTLDDFAKKDPTYQAVAAKFQQDVMKSGFDPLNPSADPGLFARGARVIGDLGVQAVGGAADLVAGVGALGGAAVGAVGATDVETLVYDGSNALRKWADESRQKYLSANALQRAKILSEAKGVGDTLGVVANNPMQLFDLIGGTLATGVGAGLIAKGLIKAGVGVTGALASGSGFVGAASSAGDAVEAGQKLGATAEQTRQGIGFGGLIGLVSGVAGTLIGGGLSERAIASALGVKGLGTVGAGSLQSGVGKVLKEAGVKGAGTVGASSLRSGVGKVLKETGIESLEEGFQDPAGRDAILRSMGRGNEAHIFDPKAATLGGLVGGVLGTKQVVSDALATPETAPPGAPPVAPRPIQETPEVVAAAAAVANAFTSLDPLQRTAAAAAVMKKGDKASQTSLDELAAYLVAAPEVQSALATMPAELQGEAIASLQETAHAMIRSAALSTNGTVTQHGVNIARAGSAKTDDGISIAVRSGAALDRAVQQVNEELSTDNSKGVIPDTVADARAYEARIAKFLVANEFAAMSSFAENAPPFDPVKIAATLAAIPASDTSSIQKAYNSAVAKIVKSLDGGGEVDANAIKMVELVTDRMAQNASGLASILNTTYEALGPKAGTAMAVAAVRAASARAGPSNPADAVRVAAASNYLTNVLKPAELTMGPDEANKFISDVTKLSNNPSTKAQFTPEKIAQLQAALNIAASAKAEPAVGAPATSADAPATTRPIAPVRGGTATYETLVNSVSLQMEPDALKLLTTKEGLDEFAADIKSASEALIGVANPQLQGIVQDAKNALNRQRAVVAALTQPVAKGTVEQSTTAPKPGENQRPNVPPSVSTATDSDAAAALTYELGDLTITKSVVAPTVASGKPGAVSQATLDAITAGDALAVLQDIAQNSPNKANASIAQGLALLFEGNAPDIQWVSALNSRRGNAAGAFDYTENNVLLAHGRVGTDGKAGDLVTEHVVLHELVHAATEYGLRFPINAAQEQAGVELQALLDKIKALPLAAEFNIVNTSELLAETYSNSEFVNKLDELYADGSKVSWFSELVDGIKQLLGFDSRLYMSEAVVAAGNSVVSVPTREQRFTASIEATNFEAPLLPKTVNDAVDNLVTRLAASPVGVAAGTLSGTQGLSAKAVVAGEIIKPTIQWLLDKYQRGMLHTSAAVKMFDTGPRAVLNGASESLVQYTQQFDGRRKSLIGQTHRAVDQAGALGQKVVRDLMALRYAATAANEWKGLNPSTGGDPALKAQWDALSPAAKAANDALSREMAALHEEYRKGARQALEESNLGAATRALFEKTLAEPLTEYSPITREGRYVVTATDADGKFVHFARTDSILEANRQQAALKTEYASNKEVTVWGISSMADKGQYSTTRGASQSFVSGLISEVNNSDLRPAAKDAMLDIVLNRYLTTSLSPVLNTQAKRKGVTGGEVTLQGIQRYMITMSNAIAAAEYHPILEQQIDILRATVAAKTKAGEDTTVAGQFVNVLAANVERTLHPDKIDPVAQKILSGSHLMAMAFSPAASLINLSQIVTGTLPFLTAELSRGGGVLTATATAGKLITNAMNDFARNPGWNSQLRFKGATFEPNSRNQQLADLADYLQLHGRLHEMELLDAVGDSESNRAVARFTHAGSYLQNKTESINVGVTAIAAYDASKLRNPTWEEVEHRQAALEAVTTTQFDNSQSNKPLWSKGGAINQMVYILKGYPLALAAQMVNDAKDIIQLKGEDRKAATVRFVGQHAMITMLGGAMATPIGYALMAAMAAMGKDDDDPLLKNLNAKELMLTYLRKEFGDDAARSMMTGFVPGINLSASLSLSPLVMFNVPDKGGLGSNVADLALQAIGPLGSVVQRVASNSRDEGHDDWTRTLQALSPRAFAGLPEVYRQMDAGGREMTKNGDFVSTVDTTDSILRILGFQPAGLSATKTDAFLLAKVSRTIDTDRQTIMNGIKLSRVRGEYDPVVTKSLAAVFNVRYANAGTQITDADIDKTIAKADAALQSDATILDKLKEGRRAAVGGALGIRP